MCRLTLAEGARSALRCLPTGRHDPPGGGTCQVETRPGWGAGKAASGPLALKENFVSKTRAIEGMGRGFGPHPPLLTSAPRSSWGQQPGGSRVRGIQFSRVRRWVRFSPSTAAFTFSASPSSAPATLLAGRWLTGSQICISCRLSCGPSPSLNALAPPPPTLQGGQHAMRTQPFSTANRPAEVKAAVGDSQQRRIPPGQVPGTQSRLGTPWRNLLQITKPTRGRAGFLMTVCNIVAAAAAGALP